jgi:NAD(P)-dependent dehydrogenase (short-subunit alcohol dehydrogenase family)
MTDVIQSHTEVKGQRVALVTGATGAIGWAIAEGIAATPGFAVVLVCRDESKAQRAVAHMQDKTGNPDVCYTRVDLARHDSIRTLAERWRSPVHVLVNNAAIAPRTRATTPEDIELQFATNVLGYFWMIRAFAAQMERSAPARIINVASYWAGGLDLQDPEFNTRTYDNDQAYRQSKQADRLLSVAFAKRLGPSGITVNACHPGDVKSTLSRDLGFGGQQTPEQAARTPVWLATDPSIAEVSGLYFENQRSVDCRFSANSDAVESLFELCERYE